MDSPPLARGAPIDIEPVLALGGLTPARAGSTSSSVRVTSMPRTHPRSRGEHDRLQYHCVHRWDSPPLARGARVEQRVPVGAPGLTPARAGST